MVVVMAGQTADRIRLSVRFSMGFDHGRSSDSPYRPTLNYSSYCAPRFHTSGAEAISNWVCTDRAE